MGTRMSLSFDSFRAFVRFSAEISACFVFLLLYAFIACSQEQNAAMRGHTAQKRRLE
jgi:hypothetical protein